jgi:hypothetical protein
MGFSPPDRDMASEPALLKKITAFDSIALKNVRSAARSGLRSTPNQPLSRIMGGIAKWILRSVTYIPALIFVRAIGVRYSVRLVCMRLYADG